MQAVPGEGKWPWVKWLSSAEDNSCRGLTGEGCYVTALVAAKRIHPSVLREGLGRTSQYAIHGAMSLSDKIVLKGTTRDRESLMMEGLLNQEDNNNSIYIFPPNNMVSTYIKQNLGEVEEINLKS